MSFQLSSGTLDSMAGVFAPSKKYRMGSGGGSPKPAKSGGTMIGFAVASMFPKANATSGAYRPPTQTKRAFGGSTQSAVSRRAIATMDRTARRVPEVMVRITGRQHGGGHVLANFAYIARLGYGAEKELGLVTNEGEVIHDGREMQELAKEWHEYEMGDDARRKGATSLSMILSMPAGTEPEQVKGAALAFANEEFANRSWVASLHVDRDHPHVHLTIARRDHDGRRFHPNRDDLFRYRQRFAQKLRDRGIEANATPAKARGLDPKHEHIAARKVRDKGDVPQLDRSRSERADRYRTDGQRDPVRPVLNERQAVVRAAYERSIAELKASPSLVNKTVASSLQRFIDGLPEPEPSSVRDAPNRADAHLGEARLASGATADKAGSVDAWDAALARSKAIQERIAARREQDRAEGRGGAAGTPTGAGAAPARKGVPDATDKEQSHGSPDPIDDIVRRALDRNEQQRERDRARERDPDRDRGGPKR